MQPGHRLIPGSRLQLALCNLAVQALFDTVERSTHDRVIHVAQADVESADGGCLCYPGAHQAGAGDVKLLHGCLRSSRAITKRWISLVPS